VPTIQPSTVTPFYWIRFYFEDDETGMLRQMAEQMKRWDKQEDFVRDWDLGDHGIHPKKLATIDEKISYLKRNAFRYVVRRFSQFLKKKNVKVGQTEAETVAREIAVHFEKRNIFKKLNMQTWMLNYSDYAIKKAV
jgi:hypothetical protein